MYRIADNRKEIELKQAADRKSFQEAQKIKAKETQQLQNYSSSSSSVSHSATSNQLNSLPVASASSSLESQLKNEFRNVVLNHERQTVHLHLALSRLDGTVDIRVLL